LSSDILYIKHLIGLLGHQATHLFIFCEQLFTRKITALHTLMVVGKSNHRFVIEDIIFGGSDGFRLFLYKKLILSLKNIKQRIKQ